MSKVLKITTNLLIPISALLVFSLLAIYSVFMEFQFGLEKGGLASLSESAIFIIDSGSLKTFAYGGVLICVVTFLVWAILILKDNSKYLIKLEQAILSVIGLWLIGTIFVPYTMFLVYLPVLEPIKLLK